MAKVVNWAKFEATVRQKRLLLLTPLDVQRLFRASRVAATFLLHRYTKRRLLTRFKRGLYALADASVPEPYVANRLYEPSYVSLEFALSYHGVIPETVYEITSVSPKATRAFIVDGKRYSFRRIKRPAFTGYVIHRQKGTAFRIADPEKAYVDLTYLRLLRGRPPLSRFHKEKLKRARALRYAKLFGNRRLVSFVTTSLR